MYDIAHSVPWGKQAVRDRGPGSRLRALHELYRKAPELNPRRWARHARNWTPVAAVTLNPERDSVIRATPAERPDWISSGHVA